MQAEEFERQEELRSLSFEVLDEVLARVYEQERGSFRIGPLSLTATEISKSSLPDINFCDSFERTSPVLRLRPRTGCNVAPIDGAQTLSPTLRARYACIGSQKLLLPLRSSGLTAARGRLCLFWTCCS